jgi:hypothetical protein
MYIRKIKLSCFSFSTVVISFFLGGGEGDEDIALGKKVYFVFLESYHTHCTKIVGVSVTSRSGVETSPFETKDSQWSLTFSVASL